jgi:hypothetical protein
MGNGIQPAIALSSKVGKKKENLQKIPQIISERNPKGHFRFSTTLVMTKHH